jgi:LmbE family N-acetylglucosaminyl deacetylase
VTGRTLLGVWAHPDDEAYLSAGLMHEHVRRGDRVVVVTATLGERGTSDPEAWPPDRLAVLRRRELASSLAAVGVTEHHVLGFEDGRCDEVDGTELVAAHIADVDPDVIVTFGPDGMTGHPDHRAISRWTTDAWLGSRGSADLWYATLTPDFHERWGPLNDRLGIFADQPRPPRTTPDRLAHVVELEGDALDAKVAALAAHASQTGPLVEAMGAETYREWWRTEAFRAYVPRASRAVRRPVAQGAPA